jgi:hypothetical protein
MRHVSILFLFSPILDGAGFLLISIVHSCSVCVANNNSSSYASLFTMGGSQAGGMLGSDMVGESGDSWHDEDGRTNSSTA